MTTTFGILILAFLVFLIYKKLNNRYQEEIFRIRMYELRDELRTLAIDKKVNAHSAEFDYIDYSISKSIEQSYFITLFYIASLEIKHSHNEKYIEGYKNAYQTLLKKILCSHDLKRVFVKKNIIINQYISGQNKLTKFIYKSFKTLIISVFDLHKYFKQKVSEVNYLPELSGLRVD